jgi:hypothetical protein
MWLGRGRDALAVLPQRTYLNSDGTLDRRPEREIVNLDKKPKMPIQNRVTALHQMLDRLQQACDADLGDQVELDLEEGSLIDGVMISARNQSFPPSNKLRYTHERGGFHSIPDDFQLLICCDEGVPQSIAEDFASRARVEFDKRSTPCGFISTGLDQLEAKLDTLDAGSAPRRLDVPTLFILGNKPQPPTSRMATTMKRMDQHQLPWRRAYANDDRAWSVADQTGSLLHAAGGHPHAVTLPGGECLPWSIGIDLSHRAFSRAASVLISPAGQLVGSWTLDQQQRREDINASVLRRLILAAAESIPASERSEGIMVVRDGRLFERENADFYRRGLGGPVTLVEFRKNGNPPMLIGTPGQPPQQPIVGWLADTPGESIGFLVTLPRFDVGDFDHVIKIRLPEAWDGMKLGRMRLARILAAQTLTPGLGLHPRTMPAPIYWADGIAGASDHDLRFRGHSPVVLD